MKRWFITRCTLGMWGIIIGYMALVRLLAGNQMTLGEYLFGWPIILLVGVRLDRQHEFDLKEIKANITAQYTKNRPTATRSFQHPS